jgi:hypothetical protein
MRHAEDELQCVQSAIMSRPFLTEELTKAKTFSCYGSPTAQGQRLDEPVDRAHSHRPQPDDEFVDA